MIINYNCSDGLVLENGMFEMPVFLKEGKGVSEKVMVPGIEQVSTKDRTSESLLVISPHNIQVGGIWLEEMCLYCK